MRRLKTSESHSVAYQKHAQQLLGVPLSRVTNPPNRSDGNLDRLCLLETGKAVVRSVFRCALGRLDGIGFKVDTTRRSCLPLQSGSDSRCPATTWYDTQPHAIDLVRNL
jgi:hypothetical protein